MYKYNFVLKGRIVRIVYTYLNTFDISLCQFTFFFSNKNTHSLFRKILKYTFIFPTSFRDISSRFCLLTRKKKRKEKYTFLSSKLTRSKETSRCILLPRNVARFIRYFSNIPIRCIQVLRTEPDRNFFHSSARGKYVYTRARSFEKFTGRKETILCPRYNRYISLQYLLQLCCTGAINLGKDWRSCNKVGSFHCSKALRISQCDRSSTSSFFQSGGKSSSSSSLGQLVVTGGLYWTVNCQRVGKVDV